MPEDCEEEGGRGTAAIEKPELLIEFRFSRSTSQVCIANTSISGKARTFECGRRPMLIRSEDDHCKRGLRSLEKGCDVLRVARPEERVHQKEKYTDSLVSVSSEDS